MAFVYLSGGQSLRVPTSRESIVNEIRNPEPGEVITFEVDLPAGGATRSAQVSVSVAQIVAVSDEPLPAGQLHWS
jgi:hypothetical protein